MAGCRACTAAMVALLALSACSTNAAETPSDDAGKVAAATPAPAPAFAPAAARSPMPVDTEITFGGELEQGGWLRGRAPRGAQAVRLDGEPLTLDSEGRFFAAFDRDAGRSARLEAVLEDGRTLTRQIAIAPRDWQIEHVNASRRGGATSEAFWQRRKPELDRIAAARAVDADSDGWTQDFIWPAKGRISGRFGAQRIYRGEPGSYHSGIDIAPGNGTPVVAPADGVVTLAATTPFSLEGHLLIIDHGAGLNSAFLHLSKIAVSEGQRVAQGQYVGNVGASGRATGPHLHWSLKWRDARLDPLLFAGPMD